MEKNTRKMSKGNLGLGLGVASLILSGALFVSNERETGALEEKNNSLVYELNKKEKESNILKDDVLELEKSLINYKMVTTDLKINLEKKDKENELLRKEVSKIKVERLALENTKKAEANKANVEVVASGDWMSFTQTHYTSYCNTGCTGKTATGMNVKSKIEYEGMSIIAVDPRKIPLGSIVEINDGNKTFKAIAGDTGGDIKGNKIDLLVSVNDSKYAYSLGVKKVKIKIIRKGWAKA